MEMNSGGRNTRTVGVGEWNFQRRPEPSTPWKLSVPESCAVSRRVPEPVSAAAASLPGEHFRVLKT